MQQYLTEQQARNLQLLNGWLVVAVDDCRRSDRDGKLVIPESAIPSLATGVVVNRPPTYSKGSKVVEMPIQVGDRVLFPGVYAHKTVSRTFRYEITGNLIFLYWESVLLFGPADDPFWDQVDVWYLA